jgi:hypothetical protein
MYRITFDRTTIFTDNEGLNKFINLSVINNKDIKDFRVQEVDSTNDQSKIFSDDKFRVFNNGHVVFKDKYSEKTGETSDLRVFPVYLIIFKENDKTTINFTLKDKTKHTIVNNKNTGTSTYSYICID